jgi:hypothetical protein
MVVEARDEIGEAPDPFFIIVQATAGTSWAFAMLAVTVWAAVLFSVHFALPLIRVPGNSEMVNSP